jgi:hypothetical protein
MSALQREACQRMKSFRDIQECYSDRGVKQFTDPQCQTIDTWTDVQHCLFGRYNGTAHEIREVHILGERNSGTKFLTASLQQCFPKSAGIKVHRDFLRPKHFFQPLLRDRDFSHSLVVIVVRDPVEWMAAMRELPYHSPHHVAGFDPETGAVRPLPWRDFVAKPWTPSALDMTMEAAEGNNECTYQFRPDQVRPCRLDNVTAQRPPWNIPWRKWRGYAPVYELRRGGQPYDHVLQLRADKLVHWILQLPLLLHLGGFLVVRYEDILRQGNAVLLQQVQAILYPNATQSLPEHCAVLAPQPQRIGKRAIPDDFRAWIEQHLDATTERLVGYR